MALVIVTVLVIAAWLVRAYAPDDDLPKARWRHIQSIFLRINVAAGFIAWLLSVLADPEHLARNIGLMAFGLAALALFEVVRGRRGRMKK